LPAAAHRSLSPLVLERVLFVGDGRVGCPVRKRDVEADDCLGCDRLRTARLEADPPVVVCAAERREVLAVD
jgi:hypothetical protein